MIEREDLVIDPEGITWVVDDLVAISGSFVPQNNDEWPKEVDNG